MSPTTAISPTQNQVRKYVKCFKPFEVPGGWIVIDEFQQPYLGRAHAASYDARNRPALAANADAAMAIHAPEGSPQLDVLTPDTELTLITVFSRLPGDGEPQLFVTFGDDRNYIHPSPDGDGSLTFITISGISVCIPWDTIALVTAELV